MLFLVVFIYKSKFLLVFSPLVGSETCQIEQIYLKRVLKMFFIPNRLAGAFTRPFCVMQTSTSRGFEKGNGLLEFVEDHDGSPGNSLRNPETLWKGSQKLPIRGFRAWLFLYPWEPWGTPIKESIRTWGALCCLQLTPLRHVATPQVNFIWRKPGQRQAVYPLPTSPLLAQYL